MSTLTNHNHEFIVAPGAHSSHDPIFGDASKIVARGQEAVACNPQGGQIGDRASGTKNTQGMITVLNPSAVELVVKGRGAPVDQAVQDSNDLGLHRRENLGRFNFDRVLVQGEHDFRQRQHEIRDGGSHVANECGRGGVDRLSHNFFQKEFSLLGDKTRVLR